MGIPLETTWVRPTTNSFTLTSRLCLWSQTRFVGRILVAPRMRERFAWTPSPDCKRSACAWRTLLFRKKLLITLARSTQWVWQSCVFRFIGFGNHRALSVVRSCTILFSDNNTTPWFTPFLLQRNGIRWLPRMSFTFANHLADPSLSFKGPGEYLLQRIMRSDGKMDMEAASHYVCSYSLRPHRSLCCWLSPCQPRELNSTRCATQCHPCRFIVSL